MKLIDLSGKGSVMVDDEDFQWLSQYKWYNLQGYAARCEYHSPGKNSIIRMHTIIVGASKGECVDHIDGNPLNNQRSNLRLVTRAQNAFNTPLRRTNTSGFKGVSWNKAAKKWVSQITFNGVNMTLGYFSDKEEAHAAYCKKAKELFGEFANDGTGPIR